MNLITASALSLTIALVPLAARSAPADDMTRQERIEKRTQGLAKRFDKLDVDHDGVVSREELDEAEIKAAGDRMQKRMARRGGGEGKGGAGKGADRLQRSDADKDGKITRDEFLAKGAPWFERADADKDGKVTKDEIAAFTAKLQKRAERASDKAAQ